MKHEETKNKRETHAPGGEPEAPVSSEKEETREELTKKAQECWDKMLRMKADFENTKKRMERNSQDAMKFANERLLTEILPIVDNLDRAMVSLEEGHDPEKVKKGLEIAQSELHQVLEQHGVEIVKSAGMEFDPKFHEAVAMVDSKDFKEGMVVDEIQKGYILNGRLIRPSRVRVAGSHSEESGE